MEKPCPCQDCQNIGDDRRPVPEGFRNIPEDNLSHLIAGADIEHIDLPEGIEGQIEACGKKAAGKEEDSASGVAFPGVICLSREPGADSKDDQQDVPCKGMEREQRMAVVHAGGIKKCENTAQQSEIHEECKHYALDPFG